MIDLSGKNVLVTGGSRGIGAACCELFAKSGAAVLVHYRCQHEAAQSVVENLLDKNPADHRKYSADLADPKEIDDLFHFVAGEWGSLDILIHNAGIWLENSITQLDENLLDATWSVNTRAVFLCTNRAIHFLNASSDGNIVNISSTAGQRGEARYSPYAASKGALISATKSWAVELAPSIRINAVAPGWVDTEMCNEPFSGSGRTEIEASIPLGRVATPSNIAAAVLFLASPLAAQITGEILNVNGGSVLCG